MTESSVLDRTDLRLLALLQRNGRATNADIAAQVNLSPSACLRRIQRLEATGVIAGYAARVDPKAVGLGLQAFKQRGAVFVEFGHGVVLPSLRAAGGGVAIPVSRRLLRRGVHTERSRSAPRNDTGTGMSTTTR